MLLPFTGCQISISLYDELRNSNVFVLSSRGTFWDYKNALRPLAGFNRQTNDGPIKIAGALQGYQKYVALTFDENKIQENLVSDK